MGSPPGGTEDVMRRDDRAARRLLQARRRRPTLLVEELLHQEVFQAGVVGRSRRQADVAPQAARLPKKVALLMAANDLHHAANDRPADVRLQPSAHRDDLRGIPANVSVPTVKEVLRRVDAQPPKLEYATTRPVFAEARFSPQAQIRRSDSIRPRGLAFLHRSRCAGCGRGCALLPRVAAGLDVR